WFLSGHRDLAGPLVNRKLIPRQRRESAGTLGSPTRDRALFLQATLMTRPDDPALPAMAQQLADDTTTGQCRSTQDCAFAVVALGKYLRSIKSAAPFDSAQLLLEAQQLANAEKTFHWSGPGLPRPGTLSLSITGRPDARGYISWIQNAVPLSPPPSSDNGIKVRRRYLDV